jgi:hypothetical protein
MNMVVGYPILLTTIETRPEPVEEKLSIQVNRVEEIKVEWTGTESRCSGGICIQYGPDVYSAAELQLGDS